MLCRGSSWGRRPALLTFSQGVGDDRQAAGNAAEDDHLLPFSALRSHPVDLRHVIGPGIFVRAHRCPSHPSILRSGPTVLPPSREVTCAQATETLTIPTMRDADVIDR